MNDGHLDHLPALPHAASVAVVIPARNAARTLPTATRSALAQGTEGDLEVVVAVGPSHDETSDVARRLAEEDPRVRVVANPTGITPCGLNRAIAATQADVVVRLDAHAVLPTGYVRRATTLLRETGSVNVGGKQVPISERGFGRAVAAAMVSPFGAGGARYRRGGDPGPEETVYLGVFRRDALLAVGGFDERLVRNQDYELNHRLREAGGQVFFHPDLAVEYTPRSTVRGLARQYYDYGRWKRAVLSLHPGSLRPRQLAPPALVACLLAGTAAAALLGRSWGRTWPVVAPVGAYGAGVGVAGMLASPDRRSALATALALATMHLAWGMGFLRGGVRLPESSITPLGGGELCLSTDPSAGETAAVPRPVDGGRATGG